MGNNTKKNWNVLKVISKDNITKVTKVIKSDNTNSVIKELSLPINDQDAAVLMESGKILFLQDATNYYLDKMNNEVEILKKLQTEKNILQLKDTIQEQNNGSSNYYIELEYAEDITSYYKDKGISEKEVVKLATDICSALESCLKFNIIHNDIKPSNIFYDGNNYKLGDFGNSSINNQESIVYFGTPNYLSPEAYNNNKTNTSSDLYSLGIVMYYLLSGKLPFADKSNELEALNLRLSGKEIPNIDGISNDLMRIIKKSCSYNMNERYNNPSEMKKDLYTLTSLNNESKKIEFTNSKLEDTISVFDTNLIAQQENLTLIINNKTKRKNNLLYWKKFLKKASLIVLLLLLLITGITFYMFNRTCDAGYINKNGICKKGYYFCDNGYVLNSDNKCQKTIKSINAKATTTCKSGYTYTNETCVSNEVKEPVFTYQCLDGFILNGTKCEKVETNDAVVTYTCPSGYANMNGVCIKGDEKDATVSYSCPSGYDNGPFLENGEYKCSKYVQSSSTTDATPNYKCSSGTLNNNKCVTVTENVSKSNCRGTTSNEKCKTSGGYWCSYTPYAYGCTTTCTYTCTVATTPKVTYTCPNGGVLNGTKCSYSGGNTIKTNAIANYTCPAKYEKIGSKCIYGKQINGTVVYTCLDSQTLVGDKCHTTITTDAVGMYTCPEGFIASGVTCIQNDFPQPVKKYSCSRIYTLNGDKCEQYEIKEAKPVFTK